MKRVIVTALCLIALDVSAGQTGTGKGHCSKAPQVHVEKAPKNEKRENSKRYPAPEPSSITRKRCENSDNDDCFIEIETY